MNKPLRALAVAALAVAVAFSGCLQAEQGGSLNPDGSGKLTMKIAIKKSMLKMMEEMAKQFGGEGKGLDPFEQFTSPEKLAANSEGVAAWVIGKKEDSADWTGVSVTGYFEDINKVKVYTVQQNPTGGEQRTLSFSAKLEKTDAGHVLSLQDESTKEFGKGLPGGGADENPELGKAMLEAMKPMLEGLKVTVSVTVPGPIKEAKGFMETKDRTATSVIDANLIIAAIGNPEGEAAKKMKALSESGGGKITWTENKVTDAELEAFKKDMAAAKEAWAKLKK